MLHECFHLKQGQELRPGMLDALNLIAGRAAQLLPREACNKGSCSLQAWVLLMMLCRCPVAEGKQRGWQGRRQKLGCNPISKSGFLTIM